MVEIDLDTPPMLKCTWANFQGCHGYTFGSNMVSMSITAYCSYTKLILKNQILQGWLTTALELKI